MTPDPKEFKKPERKNTEQEKISKIKIWQLVKNLEESKESDSAILAEIKATLLVNFGEEGKAIKGIIDDRDYNPLQMLIMVLQYLCEKIKENENAKRI